MTAAALAASGLGSARAFAAALILTVLGAAPAAAQTAVDLQLVLAVDASGSVDQYRFELQKQGYVAAFRHRRVLKAIRSGAKPGDRRHHGAMDRADDAGPSGRLVARQRRAQRRCLRGRDRGAPRQLFGGGTSISGAIDFSR